MFLGNFSGVVTNFGIKLILNKNLNKTESIELINFVHNKGEIKLKKRSLQITYDKCTEYTDCFNCTSYSDKNVDCHWSKGSCTNNTSPR